MKIIDYGKWTIALNVNDTNRPYIKIYKGWISPNPDDLDRLGGPVYQINNGKTTKSYKSKYDCDNWIQYTCYTWTVDITNTSVTNHQGPGLTAHSVFMTAASLDTKL